MMEIVGWLLFCIISGGFGLAALYWAALAAFFNAPELMILFVIFGLLSAGFGYGAVAHSPFSVVLK